MIEKIIAVVAALLVLFAVFSAVLMRSIYLARYPFAVKRRRRGKQTAPILTTAKEIMEYLNRIGFKAVEVRRGEEPGTEIITISGFGRLRRFTKEETEEIRYGKPIAAVLIFKRKFFAVTIWEISI